MAINKADEDAYEYSHAESMFRFAMTKIKHFKKQERSSTRIGFEIGVAYQYYERLIASPYLTSEKNPNSKMVLSLCKEYDKYLDVILPLRKY